MNDRDAAAMAVELSAKHSRGLVAVRLDYLFVCIWALLAERPLSKAERAVFSKKVTRSLASYLEGQANQIVAEYRASLE